MNIHKVEISNPKPDSSVLASGFPVQATVDHTYIAGPDDPLVVEAAIRQGTAPRPEDYTHPCKRVGDYKYELDQIVPTGTGRHFVRVRARPAAGAEFTYSESVGVRVDPAPARSRSGRKSPERQTA